MDKERLKQLTERAAKASELAKEIEQLQDADPNVGCRYSLERWDTGSSKLSQELLLEVLVAGRLSVIDQKERELADLIREPAAPPPSLEMGVQCVPSYDKDFGFGAQ